jgi:magnesium-transporting ATPase (P-type)
MKSKDASDELARAAAINALVIGQVFYLLNSRYRIDSSLTLKAHLGNKYLPLGIGAVAVLQLLFTYSRPFQTLFRTDSLPAWVWPRLLVVGIMFFFVVELEKLMIRSSRSGRYAAMRNPSMSA